MSEKETVFVIDDDASVRRSLSHFLAANNFHVESFCSSEEFIERDAFSGNGCLVLDVNLEGKNGFDLQEELVAMKSHLPIIFITGLGSIHMSVKALKNGAVNFLEKPFSEDELLQSINEALAMSQKLRSESEDAQKAQKLLTALTPRESEILKYVITGMLNKQIAHELQIAEQTVKLHRQNICEKLGVKSVPEIIRIAEKAGIARV
jgi:FixJ family two-component response regulator